MAKVAYEDLSGTSTPVTPNPFDGILQACRNSPTLIQERYHLHRVTRNQQQKDKILAPDFPGWILDETLTKLDGPQKIDGFQDPRNCLVFWARPSQKIKNLVEIVQQKLRDAVPDIWLMALEKLHLTVMEVTHSLTASQIESLVETLLPSSKMIADFPSTPGHSARLIKPMLSFDAAALALSFVPAAGEAIPVQPVPSTPGRNVNDDAYTYHHLRRDLHHLITQAGMEIGSRYVVPSAHLTIARFNSPNPFDPSNPLDTDAGRDMHKRKKLMREIEMINAWLEEEFWPRPALPRRSATSVIEDSTEAADNGQPKATQQASDEIQNQWVERIKPGGEWLVGEEKGLDFRKGTLWYGGGETIYLGKGIGR